MAKIYKNKITNELFSYPDEMIISDENLQEISIEEKNELIKNSTSNRATTQAKAYLKATDWYYIRKLDTGEEIPVEVQQKRNEMRQILNP